MGITLGKKKLSKGKVSLYIDYCYRGKRKKEYLGIILLRPDLPHIRQENQRKLLLAQQIKAKKELEFLSAIYEVNRTTNTFEDLLSSQSSSSSDFFKLMSIFLKNYHKKDRKMVEAAYQHLRSFHNKRTLPLSIITKNFCINFLDYLRERLRGNTPTGYFKKFRMCIDKCIEEGYLTSNPTKGIKLTQFDEVTKRILTAKEIQKLALTPCNNDEVKQKAVESLPKIKIKF